MVFKFPYNSLFGLGSSPSSTFFCVLFLTFFRPEEPDIFSNFNLMDLMPISWHGLQSHKSLLQWYIQSKAHWNATGEVANLRQFTLLSSVAFAMWGRCPGSLDGEQQHGHMGPNALNFFLGRVDSSQLPMSLMPKASWGLPVTSWGLTKILPLTTLFHSCFTAKKKNIFRDLIKPYLFAAVFFLIPPMFCRGGWRSFHISWTNAGTQAATRCNARWCLDPRSADSTELRNIAKTIQISSHLKIHRFGQYEPKKTGTKKWESHVFVLKKSHRSFRGPVFWTFLNFGRYDPQQRLPNGAAWLPPFLPRLEGCVSRNLFPKADRILKLMKDFWEDVRRDFRWILWRGWTSR